MNFIVDAESERKSEAAEEETKTTTDPPTLIAGEDSVDSPTLIPGTDSVVVQALESRTTMTCDGPMQLASATANDALAQTPRPHQCQEAERTRVGKVATAAKEDDEVTSSKDVLSERDSIIADEFDEFMSFCNARDPEDACD
jgi:hypothetical protein